MPEEISELRDLMLTAIANSVAAEDASEAAEQELHDARTRASQTAEAAAAAYVAESSARDRYRSALRRNGYVETATGPVPATAAARAWKAPAVQYAEVCDCGHTINLHDDELQEGDTGAGHRCTVCSGCREWRPAAAYVAAELAPCGCPVQYLRDHGGHQEGCEVGRSARQLGAEMRGTL